MKYKLPLAALLLSLLCLAAAPPAPDNPAVTHVVKKAVTVADGDTTIGSGTIIKHGKKTYCLTCAHVAEAFVQVSASKLGDIVYSQDIRTAATLKPYRGKSVKSHVAWLDSKRDVALLRLWDDISIDPVTLDARSCVQPDDDVYYCGASIKPFNLQRTWVSCVLEDEGALGLGIGGWYGHSGSGVFKKHKDKFELVGIIQGCWEGAGRIVKAIDLKTILASLKDFDDYAAIQERTKTR